MLRLCAATVCAVLLGACSSYNPVMLPPRSDWTAVSALRPGTPIQVDIGDGRRVTGAITAVTPDRIVLDRTTTLRRNYIIALWVVNGDNRKTGMLAGTALGLIMGTIPQHRGNEAILAPALLAAAGSAVGTAVGQRSPKRQLIYARYD